MSTHRYAYAALLAAAFLFGTTFVVIKDAVSGFPPLAFVGWRFLIGAAALLLLAVPRGKQLWRDGLIAGLWLLTGFVFQTAGLVTTGASNSALITGLYVVITPLLSAILIRRIPSAWAVIGGVVAMIGLTLITVDANFSISTGDLLTLLCAVGFAGHIVYLSRSAHRHAIIPFTAVQLLVTAVGGLALSAVFEGLPLPTDREIPALIITGIGVSAVAFLLQVWAQSKIGSERTALLLTAEPVFGVAIAAALLNERFTLGGWVGAALIVGAILIVITRGDAPLETEAEAISAGH